MDKEQAIHSFWNSFNVKAYDENSVPDDAAFPRITYSIATSSFEDVVAMTVNLWDKSTSWANITHLKDLISETIGSGGTVLPIDNGYVWLNRGSTFAQRLNGNDDTIRRIYLQLQVEFFTNN